MAGKITSAIISLISGGIVSVYSTKSLVSSINLQQSKITLPVTVFSVDENKGSGCNFEQGDGIQRDRYGVNTILSYYGSV